MNVEALCAAVWEAEDWLGQFTRQSYPAAFQRYGERFGPLYAQAVRDTDGDEQALKALADAILDALAADWDRRRFWNRKAVRVSEKQVIVNFLSPMLLDQPDVQCGRLAGALRQGWADRWPKDEYHITTYEVIQSGFRFAIMGIDLERKHLDPKKDRRS